MSWKTIIGRSVPPVAGRGRQEQRLRHWPSSCPVPAPCRYSRQPPCCSQSPRVRPAAAYIRATRRPLSVQRTLENNAANGRFPPKLPEDLNGPLLPLADVFGAAPQCTRLVIHASCSIVRGRGEQLSRMDPLSPRHERACHRHEDGDREAATGRDRTDRAVCRPAR